MPIDLIKSMGIVKLAAARVNASTGKLSKDLSDAIITAAQEVIDGILNDEFPLVIWYARLTLFVISTNLFAFIGKLGQVPRQI